MLSERAETERLTITIRNEQPVELVDLTKSLFGIADEYRRFASQDRNIIAGEDLRLYVHELRAGSIIAELVPYAPLALPLMNDVNSVVQFCQFLKLYYKYLSGRILPSLGSNSPKILEKQDYQNLYDIVEPVAKDNSSSMMFQGAHFTGPCYFNLNSMEAKAAQNGALREIKSLREVQHGIHEKVALYWYQARTNPTTGVGDRGVVESISKAHVKVDFLDDSIKAQMLFDSEYPFKYFYIVDVAIETVNDKPIMYKVLKLHGKELI